MQFRHLVVQGLVAVILIALGNVGIEWSSRNSVARQHLRRADAAEPATDLFLGNSTMQSGLDEAAFAAAGPGRRPLNLGLGTTGPVEHFLMYGRQDRHRGAAVYYGFLDTQLTDPPEGSWDTLFGNRAMAYYVNLDAGLRFYAPDDPVKAFGLRLVSYVPVLVNRYTIWAKVERVRRDLGGLGMPTRATNRFGRVEDAALLEPADPIEFAGRCGRAVADQVPLTGPVEAILSRAREQGAAAYVVEMPMPAAHRARYYSSPEWADYRKSVADLVGRAGGVVVPAADWIPDAGFSDAVHLNTDGAKAFSARLARWAADRRPGPRGEP